MAKEKLQGFEESLLEVRKVTKVTTGGRRMRFRATVLVGDRAGHIGLGVGKGNDVSIAVSKATHDAYKNVTVVPVTKSGSVPYMISQKYKSCIVMLRPATTGTGLKAGSSVRTVLELAGFANILSKIIGSNNSLNNAIATINALLAYKVNPETLQAVKELVLEKVEDRKERRGRGDDRRDNRSRPDRPRIEAPLSSDVPAPTAPMIEEVSTKEVGEDSVVSAPVEIAAPKASVKKTPAKEKEVVDKKTVAKSSPKAPKTDADKTEKKAPAKTTVKKAAAPKTAAKAPAAKKASSKTAK